MQTRFPENQLKLQANIYMYMYIAQNHIAAWIKKVQWNLSVNWFWFNFWLADNMAEYFLVMKMMMFMIMIFYLICANWGSSSKTKVKCELASTLKAKLLELYMYVGVEAMFTWLPQSVLSLQARQSFYLLLAEVELFPQKTCVPFAARCPCGVFQWQTCFPLSDEKA